MTSLTAWANGTLAAAWTPAFAAADLNGLPYLASVMSSLTPFDNTVALDQFADFSYVGTLVGASLIAAGSGLGVSLAILQADGTTYGDGRLTAGAQLAAYQPLIDPLGGVSFPPGTITNIIGDFGYAPLRPVVFRLVMTNYTGFALGASGNMGSIRTYRQNTNA